MAPKTLTPRRTARFWAWAWVCVCLIALVIDVGVLRENRFTSNLFDLLPRDNQTLEQQTAQQSLLSNAQNNLLVMVGVPTKSKTSLLQQLPAISDAWHQSLRFPISPVSIDPNDIARPPHEPALTLSDEYFLSNASEQSLITTALTNLTGLATTSPISLSKDPLGLYAHWISERSQQSPLRPQNGFLSMEKQGQFWILLRYEVDMAVAVDAPLVTSIQTLQQLIMASFPQASVLASGIPLFTNVYATTAQTELIVIGTVSIIGVLLLAWIWFGRIRALIAIATITLSALIVALACTALACGQVHLITLVFGTSLIGITVDYSAHYLCHRTDIDDKRSINPLRQNLCLAFLSTAVAFSIMALTPLPGLRQMACFCVSGLLAALIAVLTWLPRFEPWPSASSRAFVWIKRHLLRLPTLKTLFDARGGLQLFLFVALTLSTVIGLCRLEYSASIRDLNHFPTTLLQQSQKIGELTQIPSTSQYFLVKGRCLDEVLVKEEQLKQQQFNRPIPSITFQGLSDWVPSQARQERIFKLKQEAIHKLNPTIVKLLGAELEPIDTSTIDPVSFLDSSLGKLHRAKYFQLDDHWFGIVEIVGLTPNNVDAVAQLACGIEGVQWIDTTQALSTVLDQYRERVMTFLLIGLCAILCILTIRFKRDAWRAFLPTFLGLSVTTAILGWLGHPISLFTVLAGILLVGLGVDCGIFLTAMREKIRALVAITFATLTTFLSFGLLTFSTTPALHSFGLAIAIGLLLIWTATVLCRAEDNHIEK